MCCFGSLSQACLSFWNSHEIQKVLIVIPFIMHNAYITLIVVMSLRPTTSLGCSNVVS